MNDVVVYSVELLRHNDGQVLFFFFFFDIGFIVTRHHGDCCCGSFGLLVCLASVVSARRVFGIVGFVRVVVVVEIVLVVEEQLGAIDDHVVVVVNVMCQCVWRSLLVQRSAQCVDNVVAGAQSERVVIEVVVVVGVGNWSLFDRVVVVRSSLVLQVDRLNERHAVATWRHAR